MDSRPIPLDIAQHLLELEVVEGAVRDQVARLLTDRWRGYNPVCRPSIVAGRPVWWWRVRLLDWAWSNDAHERCPGGVLKGLRTFLSHLTDAQLCEFVESLLPDADGMAESA